MGKTTKVSVFAACPKCGSNVTAAKNATPDTILVCEDCGARLGTYGDLNKRATSAILNKAKGIIFKKRRL